MTSLNMGSYSFRKKFLNLRSDRGKAEITVESRIDVGLSNQVPISADFDWKSNPTQTQNQHEISSNVADEINLEDP